MKTISLLIVDTMLLHEGIPEDTGTELVYSDAIYPKHIIGNYSILEFEVDDLFNILEWVYNPTTLQLEIKIFPTEPPTEEPAAAPISGE